MTGMRYTTIVHLQGDEGYAARDILDGEGMDALFIHLLQWDYGDHGEVRDTPPWGRDSTTWGRDSTTHHIHEEGFTYVIAYDRSGSVSLNRMWWEIEPTVGQITDWRYAVANGDTTLGLEDWADHEGTA